MRAFVFLILFVPVIAFAQQKKERQLVQLSGVVLDADSLSPIPFTSVIISSTSRGTIADYSGFFSFVVEKGDTLLFSSIGYHDSYYVVPDTLSNARYSLIQLMNMDTIELKEVVVYPWPSKEEFADAFINLQIGEDDWLRAQQNVNRASKSNAYYLDEAISQSGSVNYRMQMQLQQSQLYYTGQYPVNNLMNPMAWAQFIDSWKKGAYKKK